MQPGVYLDYNATAPVRPEAATAVAEALTECGNASSVHGFGRAARQRLEAARQAVALLAGARPQDLVFTSGGTEANALALTGCGRRRLLVSAGEHESVLAIDPSAERLPLGNDGRIDLAALRNALDANARSNGARSNSARSNGDGPEGEGCEGAGTLVSVMLANNETGVIQPLAEVVELAHAAGALVHCDAVQAAGKIALDFADLGVDLMSLSAHKLGGPQGVGALMLRPGLDIAADQRGGGQERSRRAGTENLPGIAGFGAAARAAARDLQAAAALADWRDELEARISVAAPEAVVFGAAASRLPNTSCIALPDLRAETQVMALDLAGVAVSAGAACSSGKVQPSHVLAAMGASPALAGSAIRVSFGWRSRPSDLEAFLAAWLPLYQRSRAA